jgi:hypothetical protein
MPEVHRIFEMDQDPISKICETDRNEKQAVSPYPLVAQQTSPVTGDPLPASCYAGDMMGSLDSLF